MAKRTLLLPVVVAILSGAAVGLVVSGVETTYQAAASVRINPLVGVREIDRLRAAAGLDQVEERQDLPFIPADRGVFERVLRRVNRELRPAEPLDEDDATVSDSQSLLVLEHFKPPLRRLTATARATSRAEAARAANLILSVYLDERRRIYDRLLARPGGGC